MVSPLPTDILWELIVELLATPLHLEGVLNVTLRPVAAGGQQFASVQGEEAGGPHIMLGPPGKQLEGVKPWVFLYPAPKPFKFVKFHRVKVHGF